ncbi:alpha/beta hydrolase [Microbacterium sp. dk485]|uniref:alpha/beta fold hydrolase n=1 Tax=Microbacterium TaxID=33882 RepID=UPI0010748FBB|nr:MULTISPECIES: alpha/beta hydrolase [Microbacterium]TFV84130.1 alpha/beta hydrolase [Microbacterium sp. dk485]TXK16058.1 alpha/beta hydrolase [Microbacterium wangchenii]
MAEETVSPEFARATTTAQRVRINGNELAVEVLGPEGAPVIITHHGAPGLGSRAEPRASFGRLADEYRVVVFDARGSGESEGAGVFSHEQWAADIDGLREWIGADKIVMAGGSYGGFMAMEYAIRYPDRVAALVLRDTAADNSHAALARENALASDRVTIDMEKFDRIDEGRVRDNADLRDCWREILPLYDFHYDPEATERKVQATPYRYEAHNYAFSVNLPGWDIKPQLPSIPVPTLVTVGRTDWITPVSCSETIAELIPDARLEIFEESGHSPQIEQAEEWTATVRDFLHEVFPATVSPR